jgi:hypothetical protein
VKVSELIQQLESIVKEEGDFYVYLSRDPEGNGYNSLECGATVAVVEELYPCIEDVYDREAAEEEGIEGKLVVVIYP